VVTGEHEVGIRTA